jgi:hypothetical protein
MEAIEETSNRAPIRPCHLFPFGLGRLLETIFI